MSAPAPSVIDIASQIQVNAAIVDNYLRSNSLPPLSLAEDAFPFFPGTGPTAIDPFPSVPTEVAEARRSLRDSCELLLHLASTPAEVLFWNIACSHHHSGACLQYVYHFSLADAVPLKDQISFSDLANKTGVDERQCTRILRMLMTQHVFYEPVPGHVSHTAMSKLLTVPSLRDSIGYLLEEGFIGAGKISEAAEKYPGSQERNHAPWNVGHGIDLPTFEFFETSPKRMARFFGNMENMGGQDSYNIRHLIDGYDWEALGAGKVVDMGGSTGHVSLAISKKAPKLNFIVQDLENVVHDMRERTNEQPGYEKISFEAHNFFTPQPVKDADVYLLRFICHDYSDKYAAKILQSLVPALGPKSKVLIFDGVMPAPGTVGRLEERKARYVSPSTT
ncbi:hypothetical protein H2198_004256 [Neophaeococcomyces mojaviensis]|uniref:Uncharacterized protein n=1 Tax=Neophaeococcomyces mojaviensis TaxID=3383035 RepID=A0ACC3A920_9EURO|nr:hypothetical protein H2198_004256 [Knufia sp. JES_112]